MAGAVLIFNKYLNSKKYYEFPTQHGISDETSRKLIWELMSYIIFMSGGLSGLEKQQNNHLEEHFLAINTINTVYTVELW